MDLYKRKLMIIKRKKGITYEAERRARLIKTRRGRRLLKSYHIMNPERRLIEERPASIGDFTIGQWKEIIADVEANPMKVCHVYCFNPSPKVNKGDVFVVKLAPYED